MRRALISGAGGFLGAHLLRELEGVWEVVGAGRSGRPPQTDAEWLRIEDEAGGLAEAVARSSPDLFIHAAFINRKDPDWSEEDYLARLTATNLRLFDACSRHGVPVILISSSAVYGTGTAGKALDEQSPRRPVSLYGMAKTFQEMLGEHAAASRGLELCTARLFNLVGPGKGEGTVVHDWISQVSAIAVGKESPVLRVRNRETSRDFVDVRDAARAVGLLAQSFTPGEVYNVASGRAVSLRQIGDYLESLCPVPFRTVETDVRRASADALYQYGSATKIRQACGWMPKIDWRQSVRDVWESYMALRSRNENESARP